MKKLNCLKIKFVRVFWWCFFPALLLLPFLTNAFAQIPLGKPEIKAVIPTDVFPDMFVFVKGKRIYTEKDRTYVIFSQGEKIIKTYSGGGGTDSDGIWGAEVRVPQGLQAGSCKVEVEVGNNRSLPFFINVSKNAEPPKLSRVSAAIANPGYFVWIEGEGFSDNQILEMTDAEGQKFTKKISGVSTSNSLSFNVPAAAYAGIAKFKVSENRNAAPQVSNEITFEIRSGAIPLLFNKDFFVPLSRGQWYEFNFNDSRPLRKATAIDVKLTQRRKVITSTISDFRRLRFQVPKSFKTGKMNIQTRTRIGNDFSEWSEPLEFEIIEKPAKPGLHSLENVPTKAQATFRQNGEIIGILPIDFGVLPHVRLPEKIRKGNLEIYTRYWDQGNFTEWKRAAKFDNFDVETNNYNYRPDYYKENSYSFNPFFDRLFFENNSVKFFNAKRDADLVVYGNYYAESAVDLMVLLENGERKIYLKASEHESSSAIVVSIPKETPAGDWRFWLIDKQNGLKVKLPVKIRLE